MKKNLKPIIFLVLAIIICSCTKNDTAPSNTSAPAPGTVSLPSVEVYPNYATGVCGAFYAIVEEGNGYGGSYFIHDNGAEACIFNSSGTSFTTVSGITVNNAAGLISGINNIYRIGIDTSYYGSYGSSEMGFDTAVNWTIFGGVNCPDFSYRDISAMPRFSGLGVSGPISVNSSQPLSFTLDASTVTGADSVFVILPTYAKTQGKTYSAKAGTITISKAELAGPYTYSFQGYLIVISFASKKVNIGGRQYLFVKEYKYIQFVQVN